MDKVDSCRFCIHYIGESIKMNTSPCIYMKHTFEDDVVNDTSSLGMMKISIQRK